MIPLESDIKLKLDQIADCICKKIQKDPIIHIDGLYSGKFGILLFLNYYAKYTNNIAIASDYANNLLDNFYMKTMLHTFCSGLSGILYLFEFLRENDFIDINTEEVANEFDDFLLRSMRKDIENRYYDFLHGALGVGFYFLKKQKESPVIEMVKFLYEIAEKDYINNVFKWKSVLNEHEEMGYNISLSHGMSGIILYLSHVIKNKINDNYLLEMLEGAVHYILSQEIDVRIYGSYFPSYSLENKDTKIYKSRLAWCYGDLGVAYSVWYAGKVVNKQSWIDKGMNILIHSTNRINLIKNHVIDAGICHGSIGIAMMYRKIFIETNNLLFLEAARYWIKETLHFSVFQDGLAGYKTYKGENFSCDYSMLTGVSGIGIMFISYLMNDQQNWDEMFLL
jgi:exonuclease III